MATTESVVSRVVGAGSGLQDPGRRRPRPGLPSIRQFRGTAGITTAGGGTGGKATGAGSGFSPAGFAGRTGAPPPGAIAPEPPPGVETGTGGRVAGIEPQPPGATHPPTAGPNPPRPVQTPPTQGKMAAVGSHL